MAEASEQARQAWEKVVATVKEGPMNLALWQALEECVGLEIVDDTFYVGIQTQELYRASVIKAPQAMAQVESAAQKALGTRYRIEILEGQDSGAVEREAARVRLREERERQTQQRRAERRAESASESWDALSRHLHSSFAKFPDKGLPAGDASADRRRRTSAPRQGRRRVRDRTRAGAESQRPVNPD